MLQAGWTAAWRDRAASVGRRESKDRSKVINSQPMRNIFFESNSVSGSGGWGLAITNASDVRVINMVLEGTNSIQQLPPRTIIGPTPAAAVLVDDARDVSFTGSWVTGQGPFGTEVIQYGPLAVPATVDATGLARR